MAITQQPVTLEEFLKWPEEKPALELIDGEVTQKVSPQGQHSMLQFAAADRVNRFTVPRKLAFAFPELRAIFEGGSPVPDVAVYLWDRIPRTETGEVANRFYDPPDIAIEIVSPEQSVNSLVRKCLWYVERGVRIALLVDPDDRSIIIFRQGASPSARRGADLIDVEGVLPDFKLTVDELFASLKLQ
jgi:Uma2 family endonuclease